MCVCEAVRHSWTFEDNAVCLLYVVMVCFILHEWIIIGNKMKKKTNKQNNEKRSLKKMLFLLLKDFLFYRVDQFQWTKVTDIGK